MIRRLGIVSNSKIVPGTKMKTCQALTFKNRGLDYISVLVLHNIKALTRSLEYCDSVGIKFFRINSDFFPWMIHYDFKDLPNFDKIEYELWCVGEFAREKDIRLTFHPGPFNILASSKSEVIKKTILELNAHSKIFNLMGFDPSFENTINIHVGGAYGEKQKSLKRWKENYNRLDEHTKFRLTIENDDKTSLYCVQDLVQLDVPIAFDRFHHSFHPGDLNEVEAFKIAYSTWPDDIVPIIHHSESAREEKMLLIEQICEQNGIDVDDELPDWPWLGGHYDSYSKIKENAHSELIKDDIYTYNHVVDVMLEAKGKDLALFNWLELQIEKRMVWMNELKFQMS